MGNIAQGTIIMNIWGFGMVFPAGTWCTHARVSGQVEMKGKCCFGSLGTMWDRFGVGFLEALVVFAFCVILACTCEICITFCAGVVMQMCQARTVCGAALFCALWPPVGAACPRDRDSSVGGSPTCLAPLAVLLSPPSSPSQGLVVVPGLQGDSRGPN